MIFMAVVFLIAAIVAGIAEWHSDNGGGGWMLMACGLLVIAVCLFFGAGVKHDNDQRIAFMQECLKDHKTYECVAMWRAGEPSVSTVVIPVR